MVASQSIFITIITSTISIALTTILLIFYYNKKISLVELLLYGFSTQGYYVSFAGPTINTVFFIYIYLLSQTIFKLIKHSISIKKKYLILLSLPLISSFISISFYLLEIQFPFYTPISNYNIFYKPIYFYLKNFLPLFVIGYSLYQKKDELSINNLYITIEKIVIFSCIYSVFQYTVCYIIKSPELLEIIGAKSRYMYSLPTGGTAIRVSALFMEPKNLAAFLGLSLPVLLYRRKYVLSAFTFVIGLLTISQTFTIEIIIIILVFGLLRPVYNVRATICFSFISIILFFLLISGLKEVIIQSALSNKDSLIFKILAERAVERYDLNDDESDSEVLGMPIQKDLELPIVKFITKYPIIILTGYGPNNSTFVPPDYFAGVWTYNEQVKGTRTNHMNLRWLFYVFEFGLPIFLVFIWILSKIPFIGKFESKYYAMLWMMLFFNEIDLVIVISYIILVYRKNESTTQIR